jgi:hypothetical protein
MNEALDDVRAAEARRLKRLPAGAQENTLVRASPTWAAKFLDDSSDQIRRSRLSLKDGKGKPLPRRTSHVWPSAWGGLENSEPMKKVAKTLRGHHELFLN